MFFGNERKMIIFTINCPLPDYEKILVCISVFGPWSLAFIQLLILLDKCTLNWFMFVGPTLFLVNTDIEITVFRDVSHKWPSFSTAHPVLKASNTYARRIWLPFLESPQEQLPECRCERMRNTVSKGVQGCSERTGLQIHTHASKLILWISCLSGYECRRQMLLPGLLSYSQWCLYNIILGISQTVFPHRQQVFWTQNGEKTLEKPRQARFYTEGLLELVHADGHYKHSRDRQGIIVPKLD